MRCLAVFVLSCAALFGASAHQAAAQSWTGAYAGVHAGYRWADLDLTTPPYQFMSGGATFQVPARDESFSIEGALAGLHGGYNVMIAPSILLASRPISRSLAVTNLTRRYSVAPLADATPMVRSLANVSQRQPLLRASRASISIGRQPCALGLAT